MNRLQASIGVTTSLAIPTGPARCRTTLAAEDRPRTLLLVGLVVHFTVTGFFPFDVYTYLFEKRISMVYNNEHQKL